MHYNPKIKKYIQSLDALSQSTEDFLFVWDIQNDHAWFFGDIDGEFALRVDTERGNTTEETMRTVYPSDREALRDDLCLISKGDKKVHDLDYRWVNRAGKPVWINCRGNVIDDENGDPMVLLGRVSRAVFDNKVNKITGMFNKRKMLEDSQRTQFMSKDGTFLLLGVDRLMKAYSEHGREYMENLLNTCARLLEDMATPTRAVYHVEENVFAVVYEEVSPDEVQAFYTTFTKKLQKQCTITAVALPSNKQYFTDERELYDSAMEELAKAKQKRRAKLSFYSKKNILEQVNERLLEEKLTQAVNNGFEGFYILYQPQVSGKDFNLDGVEALMRFRADGVEYTPAQFIPILEEIGLMHEAGMWILKTALEQAKVWRESIPDLCLNVNVSLSQLNNPDAIDMVIKAYKESGLPQGVLTLELTETVKVQDVDEIAFATKTWHAAGINVTLDDFGTGYANMVMLREVAFDEIKIERSFISRIKKGTYSYLLVSSLIEFAHQNGISVCCEGTETEVDVLTLSPLKPDLYQGFAFDKALTVETFEEKYVKKTSREYKRRERFIKQLRRKREEQIARFDPNEVLKNVDVGLCVQVWDMDKKFYELHPDKLTQELLGIPENYGPVECNNFWFDRIKEGYENFVRKNLRRLNSDKEVMQFMYPWMHPTKGEIILSFSGVRSHYEDGKVVVKGLYRIVSAIEKTGAVENRPLKYFVENRYIDILLNKAIAFMEINVTKNIVEGGVHDIIGTQPTDEEGNEDMYNADGDLLYDELERRWADKHLVKSDKDFYEVSTCAYLKKAYENGMDTVEIYCRSTDRNGKLYDCKKSFFITRDEFKGDIMALCVIYDVSEEANKKLDDAHREATIRSLSDDYKSIMYVNVDEDTVAFYRDDKTLGDWKLDLYKHSLMMDVFAERFVVEENKAEYKYLLSLSTMREKLEKEDEYHFEYVRKCVEGLRYHDLKVKRDLSNPDELCAIIAVKDIEDEVRLRLQLERALELAYTDHLTGLLNQQGLLNKCREMLKKDDIQAAVLFMDLDNFKQVNDEYGHGMGDKVLYEVGKAIREETRGKDIVGRYGGDEFVALINGVRRPHDAEEVAERIASRVKEVCKRLKLSVNITASIGISFTSEVGFDYHHLKEIADDRLYLAKKQGKNRIVKNSKKITKNR